MNENNIIEEHTEYIPHAEMNPHTIELNFHIPAG